MQYEEARETLLHACKHSPSSRTWFGVGVACYKLGDLEQAEDALTEANILNNLDPEVWAYLTMVCLKVRVHVDMYMHVHVAVWRYMQHSVTHVVCTCADTEASGS